MHHWHLVNPSSEELYLNSRCVGGWSKVQQNAVECFIDNGQGSAEV